MGFLLIHILLICFIVQTALDDLSSQVTCGKEKNSWKYCQNCETPGECTKKWGGEWKKVVWQLCIPAIPPATPLLALQLRVIMREV